uniref:Anoctamin n=1 Tax=Sphaeramia orbicularis TaxID=375764 RepID=A0A672ZY09_9TELE
MPRCSGCHGDGVSLQREVVQQKKKVSFILLSAPWSVMCFYAEEISLRAPLQINIDPESATILKKVSFPNLMAQDVPNPPPEYYSCQFRASKLQRFLGSDNKETFFTTTQRHRVLYEILARTPYGSMRKGEVGIDRLLNEQVFSAAYPLHENPPVSPESLSLRQILYQYWAKWSCWNKYQPLDHIREYFGEKIALYFAWLGFYTGWLLPASVVGTVVFLFGFWLMATDVPAKEVCDSGDNFIMCPRCKSCSYWNYSSICCSSASSCLSGPSPSWSTGREPGRLWPIAGTALTSRTSRYPSHLRGRVERPRPEFTAMAPMTMRNPVTGAEEPYFPEKTRLHRMLSGCTVIITMIVVVLMFLISIILYRSILRIIMQKSGNSFVSGFAGRIASISGSVLNLIVILMLSRVYIMLAHILTRWEMHRTQSKYEDMFILKVFVFQIINFYSSPVYIAFFKGRFIGYPGNYHKLFGIRNEDCGAGGCLIELAQEMLVIMVGKQLINNIKEPKEGGEKEEEEEEMQRKEQVPPWEKDYQLLVCEGLFSEYLEMVLQFGFITIFVAACPLAPLFALVNNWVEIRLDAQKFVTEYRRPVVERAQDIGVWLTILQFITHAAVLSNAFLISFTSSFLPRLYYRYTKDNTLTGFINFTLATSPSNFNQQHNHTSCRYRSLRDEQGEYLPEYYHLLAIRLSFVIVFEHVVFSIGRLIDVMVPDIPEEVEVKMKREHYMAKMALAENQVPTQGGSKVMEERTVFNLYVHSKL